MLPMRVLLEYFHVELVDLLNLEQPEATREIGLDDQYRRSLPEFHKHERFAQ